MSATAEEIRIAESRVSLAKEEYSKLVRRRNGGFLFIFLGVVSILGASFMATFMKAIWNTPFSITVFVLILISCCVGAIACLCGVWSEYGRSDMTKIRHAREYLALVKKAYSDALLGYDGK
jgi:hypothetical protein